MPADVIALYLILTMPSQAAAPTRADDDKGVMCAVDDRTTMKRDAVAAIGGRDLAGDAKFAVSHGGYSYWFANAENKAAFEKSPAKYEIQFGGACARMGPLSGRGHCELNAVHEGKLYIFASKQCREAFSKAPDKLLERDEAAPAADAAARERGKQLIELMVKGMGGAARVDGVKTFRQRTERVQESGGKQYRTGKTLTVAFPDKVRRDEFWDDSTWGFVAVGGRGFTCASSAADVPMVASQHRAFAREYGHHPLIVVRSRHAPGFVAAAAGKGKAGGHDIELVKTWLDGIATTFGIDPATGALCSISYVGRGPRLTLGTIERIMIDHKTADGITLPGKWSTRFDGKEEPDMAGAVTRIEIDPKLPADAFASRTIGSP